MAARAPPGFSGVLTKVRKRPKARGGKEPLHRSRGTSLQLKQGWELLVANSQSGKSHNSWIAGWNIKKCVVSMVGTMSLSLNAVGILPTKA